MAEDVQCANGMFSLPLQGQGGKAEQQQEAQRR